MATSYAVRREFCRRLFRAGGATAELRHAFLDTLSDAAIAAQTAGSAVLSTAKNGASVQFQFFAGWSPADALELIDDHIKVNSVCPGNFFDGPLWMDPVKGLFAQYLASGKVPGAKDIADVKKFYESKIPMARGCFPEDVVRAIIYAVEQKYETGKAIPVTGGQVMLN